jgi:hypothetical protein
MRTIFFAIALLQTVCANFLWVLLCLCQSQCEKFVKMVHFFQVDFFCQILTLQTMVNNSSLSTYPIYVLPLTKIILLCSIFFVKFYKINLFKGLGCMFFLHDKNVIFFSLNSLLFLFVSLAFFQVFIYKSPKLFSRKSTTLTLIFSQASTNFAAKKKI